jgi:hypothetical protein
MKPEWGRISRRRYCRSNMKQEDDKRMDCRARISDRTGDIWRKTAEDWTGGHNGVATSWLFLRNDGSKQFLLMNATSMIDPRTLLPRTLPNTILPGTLYPYVFSSMNVSSLKELGCSRHLFPVRYFPVRFIPKEKGAFSNFCSLIFLKRKDQKHLVKLHQPMNWFGM